jgi:hypothetical protein
LARRNRNRQDQLGNLLVQVQRRFANTQLAAIGDMLGTIISDVQRSVEVGGSSSEDSERIATYVARVLEFLPSSFGDRFTFDTQVIYALTEEYEQGTALFSRMLVPKPSQAWGHQTVPMPSSDGKTAHVVDVIHLPGDDNLADINLLDYPFICHELGHNILFRDGDAFITAFGQELDAMLTAIQRQTLGIRGSSKQVADATTEQVRRYWTPTADQYNWAHEIAVDVISLWLCGPAYLAALQDVMEADGLNPYQLGQSHPPYEIRARALIDAAGRLGWAYYTGAIQGLLDRWSSTAPPDERTNLHVACGDPRLLSGAVSAAIQTCEALSLPCCTPARIAAVEDRERQGQPLEFGTDVILAAWLIHGRSTDAAYQEWERATIGRVLADLKE